MMQKAYFAIALLPFQVFNGRAVSAEERAQAQDMFLAVQAAHIAAVKDPLVTLVRLPLFAEDSSPYYVTDACWDDLLCNGDHVML